MRTRWRKKSTIHTAALSFSGDWCCSPPNNVQQHSAPSSRCKCKTYHYIHELRDGLDEGPDPFPMGLWINGAAKCANGHTARGLQGVNLEKIIGPKKMFWAAALWEDVFFPGLTICHTNEIV